MVKKSNTHSGRSKKAGQFAANKKGGQVVTSLLRRGGKPSTKRGGQSMVPQQISTDINAATAEMSAASSNMGQAAQQGFNDISVGAQQGLNNVSVGAQNAMEGLVSGAQSGVASVESAINQGAEKAKQGAQGIFGQVSSWFSGGGKSRRRKRNKKTTTLNQLMGVLGLTKKRSRSHNKTKSNK